MIQQDVWRVVSKMNVGHVMSGNYGRVKRKVAVERPI